ncbi:MAG: hypothetical protein PHC66_04075 [Candidatus Nanoarchaeia archaeon]|nr:hypothetical protein [Candidatus Nanoarchaeia archaeon]MDD5239327.1 hypothetical protein [Candidatus Nanoarchaeia archaeon]
MEIVKGKGIRVMCTHCGRERFYVPMPGTKIEDLGEKRVQCFFCGKSFKVVP